MLVKIPTLLFALPQLRFAFADGNPTALDIVQAQAVTS